MKLHKTPQDQRGTYTYQFFDKDGKLEPCIIIRPGENGVTEVDIKRLHALDDSEVYHNIKARRPVEDEKMKAKKAAWCERYIADFRAKYDYVPKAQDVEDAVNEAFPKGWIASLDELSDGDDDSDTDGDGYGDKSPVLAGLCRSDDSEDSPEVERLRELIAGLSEKEQTVYRRVLIGGEKKCVVAADLGISDVRVSQIAKKIQTSIAADKILQSFFR